MEYTTLGDIIGYDRGVAIRKSTLHVMYKEFSDRDYSLKEMTEQLKGKAGFSRSVLLSHVKYAVANGYATFVGATDRRYLFTTPELIL